MSIITCKICNSQPFDTDYNCDGKINDDEICFQCEMKQLQQTVYRIEFQDFMFLIQSSSLYGATMGARKFIHKNFNRNNQDEFFIEKADMATIMEFKSSFPGLILDESGAYSNG